jgi:hypothetical protein
VAPEAIELEALNARLKTSGGEKESLFIEDAIHRLTKKSGLEDR